MNFFRVFIGTKFKLKMSEIVKYHKIQILNFIIISFDSIKTSII